MKQEIITLEFEADTSKFRYCNNKPSKFKGVCDLCYIKHNKNRVKIIGRNKNMSKRYPALLNEFKMSMSKNPDQSKMELYSFLATKYNVHRMTVMNIIKRSKHVNGN